MKPETKYNALLGAAAVLGFGGFFALVGLVLPNIAAGNILGPMLVLGWALIVILLLYWRFRVGKSSAEITAQNKEEAKEFTRTMEERAARRAGRKGRLRRGMYGEEIKIPDDEQDDEEDADEESANRE
ncbi:MAG: hypothetical protein ACOYU3_10130 [Bacillota bacterium]